MELEKLFNQKFLYDLSFFNFENAITATYFADADDIEVEVLKLPVKCFHVVTKSSFEVKSNTELLAEEICTVRNYQKHFPERKQKILGPRCREPLVLRWINRYFEKWNLRSDNIVFYNQN